MPLQRQKATQLMNVDIVGAFTWQVGALSWLRLRLKLTLREPSHGIDCISDPFC